MNQKYRSGSLKVRASLTGRIYKLILSHTIGEDFAFAVLFSDGISDVMGDQEVVDLCRGISDPTRAAAKVRYFTSLIEFFT